MTDNDLRTLLRDDVRSREPAFTMSSHDAIAAGRRRLRASRLGAVLAGTTVVAVGSVAAGSFLAGESIDGSSTEEPEVRASTEVTASTAPKPAPTPEPTRTPEPKPVVTAQQLPAVMEKAVVSALPEGVPMPTHADVYATDATGFGRLPPAQLDKAERWHGEFRWSDQDRLSIAMLRSDRSIEGNAEKNCARGLADHTYLRCDVSGLPDGTVVTTSVDMSTRQGGFWMATSRAETDPSKLWFGQSVRAFDGSQAVHVAERVKAPSFAAAQASWRLDADILKRIALHPNLVMPSAD